MTQTIQKISKDDLIPIPVTGGWVRRPAPCDGVLVEDGEGAMFVPDSALSSVLTSKIKELSFLDTPAPELVASENQSGDT